MAGPIAEGFIATAGVTDTGSYTVSLPAGAAAGETLLIFVASYSGSGSSEVSAPTGWTKVFEQKEPIAVTFTAFTLESAGGETSVVLTFSQPTTTAVAHAYRVSAAANMEFSAPAVQNSSGSIDTVTAPVFTPSWNDDTLYFFAGAGGRTGSGFSTLPPSYTNQSGTSGLNSDSKGVALASGYRSGAAGAESPGSLKLATYNTIMAATLGFAPVGPSVTIDADMTPGGTSVLTYDNFNAAPTGTVTATSVDGNGDAISGAPQLTITGVVDDTDTAGVHSGTVTFTMPELVDGVANLLLEGKVKLELSI